MTQGLFWDGDLKFEMCSEEEKPMVKTWRVLAVDIIKTNHKAVYFPTPITGGRRAFDVAFKHGLDNIADIKEKLGTDVLVNEVVRPNIEASRVLAEAYEAKHPEDATVVPIRVEGAVRMQESMNQRFSEAAFMAFWLHVVDKHIGKMVVPDGWALSNGTTEEVIEATCIQAGLRPRTHDMQLTDTQDQSLSLVDRARDLAEALTMGTELGMKMPAQATALARVFAIHDKLQSGEIALNDAEPSLFDYDAGAMEALKQEWEPWLIDECAPLITLDGLDDRYRKSAQKAPSRKGASPKATPQLSPTP